jgi:hypothetical protein
VYSVVFFTHLANPKLTLRLEFWSVASSTRGGHEQRLPVVQQLVWVAVGGAMAADRSHLIAPPFPFLFSALVPVQFLRMHPLQNLCKQVSRCRQISRQEGT